MYFKLDAKSLQMFPTVTKTDLCSIYYCDKVDRYDYVMSIKLEKSQQYNNSIIINCHFFKECMFFVIGVQKNFPFSMYPSGCYKKSYFENIFSTISNHGLVIDKKHRIFPEGKIHPLHSSSILILSFVTDSLL